MDSARWIWFRPPPPPRDAWGQDRDRPSDVLGHLRKTFVLAEPPQRARCRVSADGRYELFVNGVSLGGGPARSQIVQYDEYDIATLLRAGRNAIAALVRWYARPTLWWRPLEPRGEIGYGGFFFDGIIDRVTVRSDHGWKAREAAVRTVEPADARGVLVPPRTEGPPPLEIVDARAAPAGWAGAEYDDSAWHDAYVLDGRIDMQPREAPLLVSRIVEPRAVVASGSEPATVTEHPLGSRGGTWKTFDFGGIVNAHPIVDAAGSTLDVVCGEDLDREGRAVTAPREWAMRIVEPAGEPVESFEAVGFRYLTIYARATGPDAGRLDAVTVGARERIAPRTEGAFFRCSDPLVEAIWSAAVRTVDLCSTDAFIDCPGREQRAWLGDAYLTSLLRLTIDPDPSLVLANLRLHARGARADGFLPMVAAADFSSRLETIPDHSLLWIAGLHALVERTNDLRALEELAPVAARILNAFERYRGADGLLTDMPGWIFIDWAQIERGPTIAALDATYAWALDLFAALCDKLGDHGSAARARDRAGRTKAAFERYWDERRGVYVDARRRVSQQTNSMAIVSGCAPRERWARILDHVLDDCRLVRTLTPGDPGTFGERMARQWQDPPSFDDEENVVLAQPFFAHFLHRAMAAAGRDIVPSIRRWEPMLARGNGCFEEYWDATPGLGSRCHAWSCTPMYDVATTILGVRGTEPGMRALIVEPQLGDLAWAEGAVATPHGFVRVSVKRGDEPVVEPPPGLTVHLG
ncbi:MAG: alpha-L-rhamnosidase N-terminal domain-containing protein [Actinomycetota bacterium]